MNVIDQFLSQLDDEVARTKAVLENVPEGHDDWKPHDKSMPFGRLAALVATMPTWFPLIIDQDSLDLTGASSYAQPPLRTSADLVKACDTGAAAARASLRGTSDDKLAKPWQLLMGGKVVSEQPKHVVVRDTFSHLAHHRGQLTVYLRLLGAPVAATYGPSADDAQFR